MDQWADTYNHSGIADHFGPLGPLTIIYALCKATGSKITPTKLSNGICPSCRHPLIAKMGQINVHHWAHEAADCDPWHESEGPWHLGWKALFKESNVERVIGPHRADVITDHGVVIELQHSSISTEEIAEREAFYKNMIWIFDLTDLILPQRFPN